MDSVVSALTSFTSGTPCVAIVNIMLDNEDFIFMIKVGESSNPTFHNL